MRTATIYTSPSSSRTQNRETLVHAEVRRALLSLAELDHRDVVDRQVPSALAGLAIQVSSTPVIALGQLAHVALADVPKRTLFARDLGLEQFGADGDADIEQLVWSSVNTIKMIAVGEPAWQSIQLLPAVERCFHDVPPLPMGQADIDHPSILVIDHEAAPDRANILLKALEEAALRVERIELFAEGSGSTPQYPWADTASIHVHVGRHTLASEQPRLVDSWYSGRLTLLLRDPAGAARQDMSVRYLTIDDQENGFLCSTPNEVVSVCHDLLGDGVLRHKIATIGRGTAEALADGWQAIAQDLLP